MKKLKCIFVMVFIISIISSLTYSTFASNDNPSKAPQASAYINSVWATASGDIGSVKITFSITATDDMSSLGVTAIEIKDSSNNTVRTFKSSSTGGLMGYNDTYFSGSKTWYGATSGCKYYAVVYFKASDSSGYDTTSYTTGYCTAR